MQEVKQSLICVMVQRKWPNPGPAPIYGRTPIDYHGGGIFSILLFPFQINSTIAHTKSATPLRQGARFQAESNTETVAGSNLHPRLESSYTAVPQHFSTACSGCASTLWHLHGRRFAISALETLAREHAPVTLMSPQSTRSMGTLSTLCNSWMHSQQYCTYPIATKQGN